MKISQQHANSCTNTVYLKLYLSTESFLQKQLKLKTNSDAKIQKWWKLFPYLDH